jgi:hypothetical protein
MPPEIKHAKPVNKSYQLLRAFMEEKPRTEEEIRDFKRNNGLFFGMCIHRPQLHDGELLTNFRFDSESGGYVRRNKPGETPKK